MTARESRLPERKAAPEVTGAVLTYTITTGELLPHEVAHLAEAETRIAAGLQTFIVVGEALAAVRVGKLYRQTHLTFETYCEQRWGLKHSQAYRLIDAAQAVAAVSPIGDTPMPQNEGQARELVGLEPEAAAEVMAKAHADTDGKLTAAAIKKTRDELAPRPSAEETAREARKAARRAEREILEGERLARYDAERMCEEIGSVLVSLEGLTIPEHRARVIDAWSIGAEGATPHNRELHTPDTIRTLAQALITYANELERWIGGGE